MRAPCSWRRQVWPTVIAASLAALVAITGCRGKKPGLPPECGNGVVDASELCDGFSLVGVSCESLGLGGGDLGCRADCLSYDLSGCEIQAECGNQATEYPETCDSSELGDLTCADFGFYTGTLACLPDCSGFDSIGCAEYCGDGVRNGPELCDGEEVSSETCESLGYYYSGRLRCAADCQSLDESGCEGYCGDGVCDRAYMENFTSCPDDCPGFVAIGAGALRSCAVASDGTAWCWGEYPLGIPAQQSSVIPVQVSNLTNAVAISAGYPHNCAVVSDGTAWCWGTDFCGELGDGLQQHGGSLVPVQVNTHTSAVGVSVSYWLDSDWMGSSCAVESDGTAWCWGYTGVGCSYAPWAVSGITSAVDVSTGGNHACAVISEGTAWCWGFGQSGDLGNGSEEDFFASLPVQVIGLTTAIAISCGEHFCCALTSNGAVWCWGSNHWGELGDGTMLDSSTPVQVIGLPYTVAISSGMVRTCAVASDGAVWCWGFGSGGALGDDSCSTLAATPVQVSGLTNVISISAGQAHSCAVISDGTAWCWGNNGHGQLGDGSYEDSCTPVQVSGLP